MFKQFYEVTQTYLRKVFLWDWPLFQLILLGSRLGSQNSAGGDRTMKDYIKFGKGLFKEIRLYKKRRLCYDQIMLIHG
jgi:hypothetical protein